MIYSDFQIRIVAALALLLIVGALHGQDAAPSIVNLPTEKTQTATSAPSPSPIPEVPELSQLDQVFKQTSLGKAADQYRLRIQWRGLENRVVHEPAVMAAKAAAESARTDLEKRERLRDYYNIYYGRMRALASSAELKSALDTFKAEHLKLLDQPRVRPTPGVTPEFVDTDKQKHHKERHSFFRQ
jgi:hypothetical protein